MRAGSRARGASLSAALLAFGSVGAHPATADDAASIAGALRVSPLAVSLSLARASVDVGERFGAVAVVSNLGSLPLARVEVTLRGDPALVVYPRATQTVRIGARTDARVEWRVCAVAPGNYLVLATAAARAPDGVLYEAESGARAVTATPSRRRCP